MKYEKIKKVYSCCGQYIAPSGKALEHDIKCPRCGQVLTTPIKCPHIVLVKI